MRGSIRRASRFAAYAVSGSLVLSGTLLAVTPAEAVTYDPQPATDAADWLTGQLESGLMHNDNSHGSANYFLSIKSARG